MCTFFRGSEIPVVHLQLFQVCDEAKDSTVILRLAALKTGDRGDRTKQLGQSLRGASLDLGEERELRTDPVALGPRTPGGRNHVPVTDGP